MYLPEFMRRKIPAINGEALHWTSQSNIRKMFYFPTEKKERKKARMKTENLHCLLYYHVYIQLDLR
jgi:hypothetical protein